MPDTKPYTRTSLLTLPLDIFLNIAVVVGDANITGLVRISWTCTTLHTFIMTNRTLWRSIVQKQLYNELIPEGGRYVLGLFKGPSAFLICCWDLYISPTQHGTRLPTTSLLLPGTGNLERHIVIYAPGCDLLDGSFPFSLEVSPNHGVEISIIRLVTSSLNAPQLGLSAKREWPAGVSLRSLVGEWAIVLNNPDFRSGEGESLWNWKSDRVERLASAPGCSLVTPHGAVVIMDIAAAERGGEPENENDALAFALTSFRMDTITSLESVGPRRNNTVAHDPLALQQDPHSASNIAALKVYWEKQKERDYDPGWISRLILHTAEETIFFIERDLWVSPPPKAWEGRIFCIRPPFEVTSTFMKSLAPNSDEIIDWFTGACTWGSPMVSVSDLSGALHERIARIAGHQLLSVAKRIVLPLLTRPREQEIPSVISESASMLEVQEPHQSSSLVGRGRWSVRGRQEAFDGHMDYPKITFPSRGYDEPYFTRATCVGFCPRSGTWLFWPPPSASQVNPLAIGSKKYSSLVLLKFDL
ncbi:hypothetical protein DL93DRAFT_1236712 [Clavulina sp. PMI_390]|nr:hypothetical protein DL93DRAFT_1236712 [Clavulina sp. PMI_390]